jgi:hypothetical protein
MVVDRKDGETKLQEIDRRARWREGECRKIFSATEKGIDEGTFLSREKSSRKISGRARTTNPQIPPTDSRLTQDDLSLQRHSKVALVYGQHMNSLFTAHYRHNATSEMLSKRKLPVVCN